MAVPTPAPRRPRRRLFMLGAPALGAALAGCISYSPREVSALSAYDLCEAHLYSRVNLTADTRALVSEEIRRRNEDCARQVPAIEADRDFELYDAMYGQSGP